MYPPPNQNLVIAQVVKFLNGNGYLAWRVENNGRIDKAEAVTQITKLLVALAHVSYNSEKVAVLVGSIIDKCYRPVSSTLKGVSDVVGVHLENGTIICVEIKLGLDKLRPEQEEFRCIVKKSGAEWWLCREINSFKEGWRRKHQPQLEPA